MNFETEQIKLNDGTIIVAPAKKTLMTNFVLKEQGDWFEHEIAFVREFIQPDMNALDIGANYGLYSTAIANNLTGIGHLWCFEPTQNTAGALRQTIEVNKLTDRVTVIEAGLSDRTGQATFYTTENAELNSLSAVENISGKKETIELLTLDQCYDEHNWEQLDFVKLDAEGEELKILEAGQKTLSECSPLIMFELKHGDKVNVDLISKFENLGYSPYYLIPNINILVPFDLNAPIDNFLLNLFCCKNETAEKLKAQGVLLTETVAEVSEGTGIFEEEFKHKQFIKDFESATEHHKEKTVDPILSLYANYRNTSLNRAVRYQNLLSAYHMVQKNLASGESNILTLSSYARIFFDIGQRATALQICNYVIKNYIQANKKFTVDRLFVPASDAFENVAITHGDACTWIRCAILDAVIRQSAFSLYFNGSSLLPLMDYLAKSNYLLSDLEDKKALLIAMKS